MIVLRAFSLSVDFAYFLVHLARLGVLLKPCVSRHVYITHVVELQRASWKTRTTEAGDNVGMASSRPFKLADLPPESRVILAAGGIVWSSADRHSLCIIHRPRYDDWSLPKGKLEVGESLEACAAREIHEETGLVVSLGPFADIVRYVVKGSHKFVYFWHMTVDKAATFKPNEEVDQLEWVSVNEACRRLTHAHEVDLLRRNV